MSESASGGERSFLEKLQARDTCLCDVSYCNMTAESQNGVMNKCGRCQLSAVMLQHRQFILTGRSLQKTIISSRGSVLLRCTVRRDGNNFRTRRHSTSTENIPEESPARVYRKVLLCGLSNSFFAIKVLFFLILLHSIRTTKETVPNNSVVALRGCRWECLENTILLLLSTATT
jgi:hypothetical protein